MCGILVAVNLQEKEVQTFHKALNEQTHRGPDMCRTEIVDNILLGFNRLSILDLSELSMQPVKYLELTLVMNGEIYNYKELRSNLSALGHTFKSNGDAEVLAAAIDQWGFEQALKKVAGMFAVVAYNHNTSQLFIARDRLGIKPLYY